MAYEDNYTDRATIFDDGDVIEGHHIRNLYEELGANPSGTLHNSITERFTALDTELGSEPSGSYSTVKARFDALDTELGSNPSGSYSSVAQRLDAMAVGGGGSSPFYEAADYGVLPSNSAQTNGAALRTLVSNAYTASPNGYAIRLPRGVIEIDDGSPSGSWGSATYAGVVIHSNSMLIIPKGTILRFMGPSNTNGVPATVRGSTVIIAAYENSTNVCITGGGIIDGNANNLTFTSGSHWNEGVALWRQNNALVSNLEVRNCRSSYNAGGTEAFQVNLKRSTFCAIDQVVMRWTGTGARGYVAGGLHVDYSSHCRITNCWFDNVDVQGMSCYLSKNITFSDCIATRNKRGFNFEYSSDIVVNNCISGGFIVSNSEEFANDDPNGFYTDRQNVGNSREGRSGYGTGGHILFGATPPYGTGHGVSGGPYTFNNCTFAAQNYNSSDAGFSFTDPAYCTASGTAGSGTITLPSTTGVPGLIGTYVMWDTGADAGQLYKVTAVASATSITVSPVQVASHSSQRLHFLPRPITFNGCQFNDNGNGMRADHTSGSTSPSYLKMVEFRNCSWANNTTDFNGVLAGLSNTYASITRIGTGVEVTNRVYTAAGTAMSTAGTLNFNHLPFPITVYANGCSAAALADRYSAVASLVSLPVTSGGASGSTTYIKASASGAITSTTMADDAELAGITLTSPGATGGLFSVYGHILYTAPTAEDIKFALAFTPTSTGNFNQSTRFYGWDTTTPTTPTQQDSYSTTASTAVVYAPDNGSGTETPIAVGGGGSSTRKLFTFEQRIQCPGSNGGTWALRYAQNTSGATGINVRDGSFVTFTPLNGGSVGGGSGSGSNISFIVPAGGVFTLTATSAKAFATI